MVFCGTSIVKDQDKYVK